jgi:hypothetical protein
MFLVGVSFFWAIDVQFGGKCQHLPLLALSNISRRHYDFPLSINCSSVHLL